MAKPAWPHHNLVIININIFKGLSGFFIVTTKQVFKPVLAELVYVRIESYFLYHPGVGIIASACLYLSDAAFGENEKAGGKLGG